MSKRMLAVLSLTALLVAPTQGATAAETYFVQPETAKILARPSFDAAVVGTVSTGYRFSPSGQKGRWFKLSFQGKEGYIAQSQVSSSEPLKRTPAGVAAATTTKLKSSRERASAGSVAVAGVKGLTYEDRTRASARERVNYEALEKMESLKVRPEEQKAFAAGGKP